RGIRRLPCIVWTSAPGANSAGSSEWPEGSIAPWATLLQGVAAAGWFCYQTEYCAHPRPGGEYCRQLGVAGRFNRAEGDAPTGGGASRVVWSSLGIVWEPPPRGRIAPAARSGRKARSRRGRRSCRHSRVCFICPGGYRIVRKIPFLSVRYVHGFYL